MTMKKGLTVVVRKANVDMEVLNRILDVKGGLIKESLGVTELPVEVDDKMVSFPWFAERPEREMVRAARILIAAICKMSFYGGYNMRKKTAPDRKQLFMAFLSRLGIDGSEYANEIDTLTKNFDKD